MNDVKSFGAVGDGTTDDTSAVLHALEQGEGTLEFPRGDYLISKTIEINLEKTGRIGILGRQGTAKIIMSGPGPAFRIVGNHGGTGNPNSVNPDVWSRQRMPILSDLEITATHAEADGIEFRGTMQAVVRGVLIRQVRHGIRLVERNRNVLVHDSHIYHNHGVGIFLDGVNLHQINICGNHVSYNRLGGIRIERSEVRNLQITGNDIEYNNHADFDTDPEPTAEIYVDTTAEGASVNEITVAANTIQATPSRGGANVRIMEQLDQGRPPGLWSITGNVIGNQENNIHLTGCYGVLIQGNCIYSCEHRNVLMEQCRQINLTGNNFRRHTPKLGVGVKMVESSDCLVGNCQFRDESSEGQSSGASLLELLRCQRTLIQGVQFIDGAPWGLHAIDCDRTLIGGCSFDGEFASQEQRGAVRFEGLGSNNRIRGSFIRGRVDLAKTADVSVGD